MATHVMFNGYDLTRSCIVGNIARQFMPSEANQIDVPKMDGALFASNPLSPLTITMSATVLGTPEERSEALRTLASYLRVSEPSRLAISDDGWKYYLAVPSGAEIERYIGAESFELTFTCLDPVMYGDENTATATEGTETEIVVGGNYPTMPTLTLESATPDSTTGCYSVSVDGGTFDIPVAHDDSAIIADCSARTLSVGGSATLPTLASDWIVLEPGTHTVSVTGTGDCTIAWVERWI